MTIEKKTAVACYIKGARKIKVWIHYYSPREKGYELYFYKEAGDGRIKEVIKWFYRLRDLKEFLAKYETEEELLENY